LACFNQIKNALLLFSTNQRDCGDQRDLLKDCNKPRTETPDHALEKRYTH